MVGLSSFPPFGLSYSPHKLNAFIHYFRGTWFNFFASFRNGSKFNANSINPDQTPRSAASDLGLTVWLSSYKTFGING